MGYDKAKIYQIVNDISDDIYIGSTCQPLSKRMAEHRASMRSNRDNHIKLYQKMSEIGVEHFRIELIKECPCENIEQLRAIEGQHIREMATLNSQVAGRTSGDYSKEFKERYKPTKQHYRENNRDLLNEKNRTYYNDRKKDICEKHRQKYNEMTRAKITCDVCGGVHNTKNTPTHIRTKKHQDAINNILNSNNVSLQTDDIRTNGEETKGEEI